MHPYLLLNGLAQARVLMITLHIMDAFNVVPSTSYKPTQRMLQRVELVRRALALLDKPEGL